MSVQNQSGGDSKVSGRVEAPSVISPTYCNQASASASPEITLLKSSLTDFIASINQLLMHYNTELVTVT